MYVFVPAGFYSRSHTSGVGAFVLQLHSVFGSYKLICDILAALKFIVKPSALKI